MVIQRILPPALIAVVAAGCGGSAVPSQPSEQPGRRVPAAEWVQSVCAAEAAWFDGEDADARDLIAGLSAGSSAQQWKRAIGGAAAKGSARSMVLVDAVQRAGIPDVDRGSEMAAGLQRSAAGLKATYDALAEDASGLDPAQPAAVQRQAQQMLGRVKTRETVAFNQAIAAFNLDLTVSDRAAGNADCRSAFSFSSS